MYACYRTAHTELAVFLLLCCSKICVIRKRQRKQTNERKGWMDRRKEGRDGWMDGNTPVPARIHCLDRPRRACSRVRPWRPPTCGLRRRKRPRASRRSGFARPSFLLWCCVCEQFEGGKKGIYIEREREVTHDGERPSSLYCPFAAAGIPSRIYMHGPLLAPVPREKESSGEARTSCIWTLLLRTRGRLSARSGLSFAEAGGSVPGVGVDDDDVVVIVVAW